MPNSDFRNIFISYSHKDEEEVIKIIHKIEEQGYSVFYDTSMSAGDNWKAKAEDYVYATQCTIYFASLNSIISKPCYEELEIAYTECANGKYYYFAVLLDNMDFTELTNAVNTQITTEERKISRRIRNYFSKDDLYVNNDKDVITNIVKSLESHNIAPMKQNPSQSASHTIEPEERRIKQDAISDDVVEYERHGNEYYAKKLLDKNIRRLSVKEGTTVILEEAFMDAEELKSVQLPEGLEEIGNRAFYNCPNLTSVNLPASIEEIGDEAFSKCPKLVKPEIPNSVVTGKNVFDSKEEENHKSEDKKPEFDVSGFKNRWLKYEDFKTLSEHEDSSNVCNLIGEIYYYGEGIPQSYENAVKYYIKAAEMGNADAQFNLGWCYFNGHGVEFSQNDAMKWYCLAADNGSETASSCYKELSSISKRKVLRNPSKTSDISNYKDKKLSEKNFEILLQNADTAEAYVLLGDCYLNGNGVKKNRKECEKWYLKAAYLANAEAQYKLGCFYRYSIIYDETSGIDTDYGPDLYKGRKWLTEASELAYEPAKEELKASI